MRIKKFVSSIVLTGLLGVAAIAHAPEKDIVDTAVGAGKFTTLVKLVQTAGLVDVLKGKGPFTVLAPTDEAFAKLPKATVEALLKDKEALKRVLLYHVVPGNNEASTVVKATTLETANKLGLKVKVKGGTVTINNAKVIATDVKASNGVIHVIDTVLVPAAKSH
ncbi:MAG: fasciclin domain-containing protein [Fimbriimonadaceae bacterium]|nr:fasciclin domain-containing protein [Fimbriimonadaceae bacterium]